MMSLTAETRKCDTNVGVSDNLLGKFHLAPFFVHLQ
jgi:hypothetical protein